MQLIGQVVYPTLVYPTLAIGEGGRERREKLVPVTTVRSGYRIDKKGVQHSGNQNSRVSVAQVDALIRARPNPDCSDRRINEVTPTAPSAPAA